MTSIHIEIYPEENEEKEEKNILTGNEIISEMHVHRIDQILTYYFLMS